MRLSSYYVTLFVLCTVRSSLTSRYERFANSDTYDMPVPEKVVYDITTQKDILISDICNDSKKGNAWNLPNFLYLRINRFVQEGQAETLLQPFFKTISKECIQHFQPNVSWDYGIFFKKEKLCNLTTYGDMNEDSKSNNFVESATMITNVDKDGNDLSIKHCSVLCQAFLCSFDQYEETKGIDVDQITLDCIIDTCPNVIRKSGFLVVSITLNKISTILSFGGFERTIDSVVDKYDRVWKHENAAAKSFYFRISVKSATGFEIDKVEEAQAYLQDYSSWRQGWRRDNNYYILESSKTYKSTIENVRASMTTRNHTAYPKIELDMLHHMQNTGIDYFCYFWRLLRNIGNHRGGINVRFTSYIINLVKWEYMQLFTKNAESLCNIKLDPRLSFFIYGVANRSAIQTLKKQMKYVNYTFPALTFLGTESINLTGKNVYHVTWVEYIHNAHRHVNRTLKPPAVLFLNIMLSQEEELDNILLKLDDLLMLRKQMQQKNEFAKATFLIEFNISAQTIPNFTTSKPVRANIFCWNNILQIKELQDSLINWAYIHEFMVIPFPLFETSTNIGWSYNVVPDNALAEVSNFPVTVQRNCPIDPGSGYFLSCVTKCVENKCKPDSLIQIGHHYGVTLHLDEHLQFAKLTETDIKNFLLLAFSKTRIVELVVYDHALLNKVIKILTNNTKQEIASRAQKPPEDIVLFLSVTEMNNFLIANNNELVDFFPKRIHANILHAANSISENMEEILNTSTKHIKVLDQFGIHLNDCFKEISNGLSTFESSQLFKISKYVVCDIGGFLEDNYVATEEKLQLFLDTQLFISQYFKTTLKKETYFRVLFNITCKTEQDYRNYNNFLSIVTNFADIYQINYFFGDAFLNCSLWKITDYSNLRNSSSYEHPEPENFKLYADLPLFDDSPSDKSQQPSNLSLIISIPVLSLFTVVTVISAYMHFKHRKPKILSKEDVNAFLKGEDVDVKSEVIGMPYIQVNTVKSLGFNKSFETPKKYVFLGNRIGTGNFGEVFKAKFKDTIPVAVKLPNSDCSKEAFKTMLTEVKILSYLGNHQNLLKFVGAYTKEIDVGLIYIITEFCVNGTLEEHLRSIKRINSENTLMECLKHSPVPLKKRTCSDNMELTEESSLSNICSDRSDYTILGQEKKSQNVATIKNEVVKYHELFRFSAEIASGMEYISSRKVIHSDLSTRNVLLNEKNICKISDFGLSRKLYERTAYIKQGKEALPWRWMALESLKNMEFTTKSDVWSYGVTLWEIFSLGDIPYPGVVWDPSFTNKLEEGLRLCKPELASEEIYTKMLLCWNSQAEERPNFLILREFFDSLTANIIDDSWSTSL